MNRFLFGAFALWVWLVVGAHISYGQTFSGTAGSDSFIITVTGTPYAGGTSSLVEIPITVSSTHTAPTGWTTGSGTYWWESLGITATYSGGGTVQTNLPPQPDNVGKLEITGANFATADGTVSITVMQQYNGGASLSGSGTFSFAWNHTTHTATLVTPVALSQKQRQWTVTNSTGSLGEWGLFQYASTTHTIANSTGLVLQPTWISPGGSHTFTLLINPGDPDDYSPDQIDLTKLQGVMTGPGYALNATPIIGGTAPVGYGGATTITAVPTAVADTTNTDGGVTGGTSVGGVTVGGTATAGTPLSAPITTTAGTISSSGGGTAGPGTGGASDTGLQNAASAINTGTAVGANSVVAQISATGNQLSKQGAADAASIVDAISANGTGGVVSAVNAAAAQAHSDAGTAHADAGNLHTDLTTGTVGNALGAQSVAATAGIGGVNSQAGTDTTNLNSALASDLGGSGTVGNNATFTGTGVGTTATGAADGFLSGSTPDQPFGDIQLSPGIRSFPAQHYLFSFSSSVGGLIRQMAVLMSAICMWGAVIWFALAVQDLTNDFVARVTSVSSQRTTVGPENLAVPGAAQTKDIINAATWIGALAAAYAVAVALVNTAFSGASINPLTMFHTASAASSLPWASSWGGQLITWFVYSYGIGTELTLLGTYWVLRWQMSAIILSAAAVLRNLGI